MGFLADLGRSGGLRRLTSEYQKGQEGLLDTAMEVRKYRRDERLMSMKEQKFGAEMDKLTREKEEYERPMNIYNSPVMRRIEATFGKEHPNYKSMGRIMKGAMKADDEGWTTAGLYEAGQGMVKEDQAAAKATFELFETEIDGQLAAIEKKMAGGTADKAMMAKYFELRATADRIGNLNRKREAALRKEETDKAKEGRAVRGDERAESASDRAERELQRKLKKDAADTKEDALAKETEIRQGINRLLGLSDQYKIDRAMGEKAMIAYDLSSKIRRNPTAYGLPADAGAAEISALAVKGMGMVMEGPSPEPELLPSHGGITIESFDR